MPSPQNAGSPLPAQVQIVPDRQGGSVGEVPRAAPGRRRPRRARAARGPTFGARLTLSRLRHDASYGPAAGAVIPRGSARAPAASRANRDTMSGSAAGEQEQKTGRNGGTEEVRQKGSRSDPDPNPEGLRSSVSPFLPVFCSLLPVSRQNNVPLTPSPVCACPLASPTGSSVGASAASSAAGAPGAARATRRPRAGCRRGRRTGERDHQAASAPMVMPVHAALSEFVRRRAQQQADDRAAVAAPGRHAHALQRDLAVSAAMRPARGRWSGRSGWT
jgi:hypothetical protein